jgi:hypothetical protein
MMFRSLKVPEASSSSTRNAFSGYSALVEVTLGFPAAIRKIGS